MTDSTPTTTAAGDLRGLTQRYGPVTAVGALDLRLAPGEVVALLGPGRRDVDHRRHAARADPPDAGAVHLFGRTPREAVEQGLVGAMRQNGPLPGDVTVAEPVELYASLHRAPLPTVEALGRAGVADLARRRPGALSGGRQQRVRFALNRRPGRSPGDGSSGCGSRSAGGRDARRG